MAGYKLPLHETKFENFKERAAYFLGIPLHKLRDNYLVSIAPTYELGELEKTGSPLSSDLEIIINGDQVGLQGISPSDIITAFDLDSYGDSFIPGMLYCFYDKNKLKPLFPEKNYHPYNVWFTYNPENASSLKDALALVLKHTNFR